MLVNFAADRIHIGLVKVRGKHTRVAIAVSAFCLAERNLHVNADSHGQSETLAQGKKTALVIRLRDVVNNLWAGELYRPYRGSFDLASPNSHRFRGGLRSSVPTGLLQFQSTECFLQDFSTTSRFIGFGNELIS